MHSNKTTDLQHDEIEELKGYKDRFKIALKAAKICVFEVDLTRHLYTFFDNAEDIFGVSGEQILKDVQPYQYLSEEAFKRAVSDYFSHSDDEEVIEAAFHSIARGQPATYNARMRAGTAHFVWCKVDVTPILKNGQAVKMIGVITDIDDIKSKSDILERKTTLDSFTGLFNKQHSANLIAQTLKARPYECHALVLFDLDDFKKVNDTWGHAAGDQVILSVSRSLKQAFRQTDIVGRFGGDEFIVLVKNISDEEWLNNKLTSLITETDDNYKVTKSVGISFFPKDGQTLEELFDKTDKALYKAKTLKNSCVFFKEN